MPWARAHVSRSRYLVLMLLTFLVPVAMGLAALMSRAVAVDCADTDKELGKVLLVNAVFRHGDRTPMKPCPRDTRWGTKQSWGELTQLGRQQAIQLGEWLAKRYPDIRPSDVQTFSSVITRTKLTARGVLEGMFGDSQLALDFEIKSTPVDEDNMLAMKKECGALKLEDRHVSNTPEMKCVEDHNHALYQRLSENCGEAVENVTRVSYLYNVFYTEDVFNQTLPEWTKEVYPEAQRVPSIYAYLILPTVTPRMKRLCGGPLLANITNNLMQTAEGSLPTTQKIFLYSGHDRTVGALLRALQVFKPHWPSYVATVLVELRQKDDQLVVTVFYRYSPQEDPVLLTLPNCSRACPLDTFRKIVLPFLPEDWDEECDQMDMDTNPLNLPQLLNYDYPSQWHDCFNQ